MNKRNQQAKQRAGPVRLPGRRWREAKMGDFKGLAQWVEILGDAGR